MISLSLADGGEGGPSAMRRAIVAFVLVFVVAAAATPAAATPTVVVHDEVAFDYIGPVNYCGFPLVTSLHEEHRFRLRYADLPDGLSPSDPAGSLYQVEGQHFTDFSEVVTNPENGREVVLHGVFRLMRRDIDSSNITLGPNGEFNGFITAEDHESLSVVGRVEGSGPALLLAGHERRRHTSFFMNDIRVGRTDLTYFSSGPVRDQFCAYLAGF